MKLSLLCLLSLIGVQFALSIQDWTQVAPLLIRQQVTWPVAQNYCLENHLDLFTIKTASDQVKLIREMNKYNEIGPVWTGLYNDLDSWYWSYNHLPLNNVSISKWYTGQPNNAINENVCGILSTDGTWWSEYCYYTVAFICYDAKNSPANRFVGYGSPVLTWFGAQTYCRQYHTDLATTTTEEDITIITPIITALHWTGAWFGLKRDTWEWSDGTQPLYLPWLSGQPDNFYTWENCGAALSGQLQDEKCTNQYYFVCSAYQLRRQIVKLEVQSDKSVFDPAVQSTILDLINQKLQEYGVSVNTTAAWNVQADGSIFNKVKDKK